jgi:membrane protein DedA with SNARE-associated domain
VLASLTSHLTSFVGDHGLYAVFALMAIDAVLPAGSEIVMLYAGALAAGAFAGQHVVLFGSQLATGAASYTAMVLAGALGYLAGSIAGWGLGAYGGHALVERHGRWLHITPDNLERAERWFARFGGLAVFLGRLTPLVRSFISIPAGVLGSPLGRYTLLTLAGSLIWCAALAGVGWGVGTGYERFHHSFRYADYAVVLVIALAVAAAVVHRAHAVSTRR